MQMARLIALFALAVAASAQYTGWRTYGSRHGFGNVVFPGTGSAPPMLRHPFGVTDPGFAWRLGGIVSGFRPYTGAPLDRRYGYYPRRAYVPVAYPVFIGGYYPGYADQPNVTIVNQSPPPPQIIINNYAAPPEPATPAPKESDAAAWKDAGVSVYQAPSSATAPGDAESEATVYLIAFKDGAIYSALAWWVEGDTLHYVTTQGKPNKASLTLIDRAFSERLNRERSIDFHLPAK